MSEPTNLWNAAYEASPAGTDLISNGDDEIRDFKKDIRERHEREHVRNATDKELDGLHREGSARTYYDASEPTDRPDGTSLDTNDDGRLWYDPDTGELKVYSGSGWDTMGAEGEARIYVSSTEPTNKPDGTTALDTDDEGRLWYDSTNDILYVWTGSTWEEPAYVKTTEDTTFDERVGIGVAPTLGSLHIEATDGNNDTGLAITGGTGDSFRIWHDGDDVKINRSGDVAITIDDDERVTFAKGRVPTGKITGDDLTENEIFDALSPYVPSVGDEMIVSGGIYLNSFFSVSRVERVTSSRIALYTMSENGGQATYTVKDGTTTTLGASLAW